MTQAKNHHGYYVTARLDSGANARTAWLMGPFADHRAAERMVEPVRGAVSRHSCDPRFAFAGFGTSKRTQPIDKPLPAGRFDMAWCDDQYCDAVIRASRAYHA